MKLPELTLELRDVETGVIDEGLLRYDDDKVGPAPAGDSKFGREGCTWSFELDFNKNLEHATRKLILIQNARNTRYCIAQSAQFYFDPQLLHSTHTESFTSATRLHFRHDNPLSSESLSFSFL